MKITVISASLVASEACRLPYYKFSTVRGAIGINLRKVACIKKTYTCEGCSIILYCPYAELFDAAIAQKEHLPFVSYCQNIKTDFAAGDALNVKFTIMGEAIKYAPYVLLALDEMCSGGIGVERTKFNISTPPTVETKSLSFVPAEPGRYRLHMISPLRAKQGNKLAKDVSLLKILNLAANRVKMLYGLDTEWSAGDVKELLSNLKWLDVDRYSNRQKSKMSLGGFVGVIAYEDTRGYAAGLLNFVSELHIGKQTTFGYGKLTQEKL